MVLVLYYMIYITNISSILTLHVYLYSHSYSYTGQFDQVITKELPCIKGALELLGSVLYFFTFVTIVI